MYEQITVRTSSKSVGIEILLMTVTIGPSGRDSFIIGLPRLICGLSILLEWEFEAWVRILLISKLDHDV